MVIDGKTRTLGLIGNPVEHTMSPVIHNALSKYLNINEVYVPFHVKNGENGETLESAVRGAFDLNILGLNVTVPYKNDVMKYLTDIDEGGRAIGAVNTLVRMDKGYKGYNTDMMGLSRELLSYGISLTDRKVIILGAGGAAKAASYMCVKNGASHVYILNRTLKKAEDIATHMNGVFGKDVMEAMNICDYEKLPFDKYIVFQSTSKGLYPDVNDVIISDENFYRLVDTGIDLIYKPFCTKFMSLCTRAGAKAYNGLKMLLYQGIIAYELWNDINVSEDIADKIYMELLKKSRDNIILTGFMGSGKTTVGHELAKTFGYDFLDTDKYIEDKYNITISEIFATKGEGYFRNLETETLKELNLNLSHTVLSTGGGLPLREENVRELGNLGSIVYLKVSPEEVIKRLAGDETRPLLAGENPEQKARELLNARTPVYEGAADCVITVDNKVPGDIAGEIMNKLKNS